MTEIQYQITLFNFKNRTLRLRKGDGNYLNYLLLVKWTESPELLVKVHFIDYVTLPWFIVDDIGHFTHMSQGYFVDTAAIIDMEIIPLPRC